MLAMAARAAKPTESKCLKFAMAVRAVKPAAFKCLWFALAVIPAKAGIHEVVPEKARNQKAFMDTGFRRDDEHVLRRKITKLHRDQFFGRA